SGSSSQDRPCLGLPYRGMPCKTYAGNCRTPTDAEKPNPDPRRMRPRARTTGQPGQGVDGTLLCSVINPSGRPAALRATRAGKTRLESRPMNSSDRSQQHIQTRLITSGRDTKAQRGFVNPPVFHGSTVLYPTAEDLHAHRGEFTYG
ncbi:hypothetical protein KXV85_004480, partial [Aspergillus fumigatus]